MSGVDIEDECEREEEMFLQVHQEHKTGWEECNSAAKSGSDLVIKGTDKVEVPNTLGMVFTSKVCYWASQVSASSTKLDGKQIPS